MVQYRFDPTYSFRAEIPNTALSRSFNEAEFKIPGIVRPGVLTTQERVIFSTRSDLLDGLQQWADRIHEELLAVPAYRKVTEQTQRLEELIATVGELPNEYFTQQEAEGLKTKLDDLERRLRENLEAAVEDKKELQSKTAAIHRDIEDLKQTVESLKKPGWVGSVMVKVMNWSKDPSNRQLLKSGSDLAKSLLLPSGSNPGE